MGYEPIEPREPDALQATGTEYGGIEPLLPGMMQPKGYDAITNGERLRLEYSLGVDEIDLSALEDRRQMLGLRPADGGRPTWLSKVSPTDDPRLESEASRQGYTTDEDIL
jgi:hypothetical protein